MSSEVWMCVYVWAIWAIIAVKADEIIEITFVAIQDNLQFTAYTVWTENLQFKT